MGKRPAPSTALIARIESPKPLWVPNRAAPPTAHTFTIKRRFSEKMLFVGDLHLPYTDQWRLGQVYKAARDLRPTVICQVGDAYDLQHWSRYETDEYGMTPEEELRSSYMGLYDFWRTLSQLAPRAKKHQLLGNHDTRILKHASRHAPKLLAVLELAGYRDLWSFPEFGVHTAGSDREVTVIDGIAVHHGHKMKLGDHAMMNLQHTVTGHTHRGGVFYRRFRGDISIAELNCGYVADDNSPAMAYTPLARSQSVPGFGWWDADGPRFYPL